MQLNRGTTGAPYPTISIRCEFKMLVLVYKSLNGLAPEYLADCMKYNVAAANTRQSTREMLQVSFTTKKTFADRSFSVAGPRLWNKLPIKIRKSETVDSFKNSLKTYLFTRTYGVQCKAPLNAMAKMSAI